MSRFVSALGPDLEPEEPKVKYHKSTRYYADALTESELLRKSLDKSLTTVIYQLSYDPETDKFFSWRQADGASGGNARNPDDKTTDDALAYEIFSTPSSLLLSEDGQRVLNKQVDLIATHSQMAKPGNAGPP